MATIEGTANEARSPLATPSPHGGPESRQQQMARLSREIRTLETTGRPSGSSISSGHPAMDRCLPDGGYAPGSSLELVHAPRGGRDPGWPMRGWGIWSLALRLGIQGAGEGKYLVVIDRQRQFFAPGVHGLGVHGLGVPCERLLVLRPNSEAEANWGIDQSLRCPAVGGVIASVQRLEDRVARRWQLATEQGGGLGIWIRDAISAQRYPSWSEVQWLVRSCSIRSCPSSFHWRTRWWDLELRRAVGGRSGARLRLGIDARGEWVESPATQQSPAIRNQHESTSAMHLAAQLAQPARRRRRGQAG